MYLYMVMMVIFIIYGRQHAIKSQIHGVGVRGVFGTKSEERCQVLKL